MRVLLVGGSPEPSSATTLTRAAADCDVVVAIDRGLDAVLAAGVSCDLFCGDADSVSSKGAAAVRAAEATAADARVSASGQGVSADTASTRTVANCLFDVVRYDPHKDATDLELALDEVLQRWPGATVRATCMSGGAPDHALAVLGRLAAWPGHVEVWEDAFIQRILKAGESWPLDGHVHERFTFIPLTPEAVVSEHGMRWELDHKHVPLLSDLGVSNVIDAEDAVITCHEGTISAWSFKGFFAGA